MGEADYDALCAALMATARGRDFIDEHARRVRQGDTAVALEALTRLEGLLKQRQTQAEASARLHAELRAMVAAIITARRSFNRFEGTVAKSETVLALFDLLERRITALISEVPEVEPQPANENEARDEAPAPVAAAPPPAPPPQAVLPPVIAPTPEPEPPPPVIQQTAPEPIVEQLPATEPPPSRNPLHAVLDAVAEFDIFPDEIFAPYQQEPATPLAVAPVEPVAVPIPAPLPPPDLVLPPTSAVAAPMPARAVIAHMMALTPAERIALFS
jgi:hypothetical protein